MDFELGQRRPPGYEWMAWIRDGLQDGHGGTFKEEGVVCAMFNLFHVCPYAYILLFLASFNFSIFPVFGNQAAAASPLSLLCVCCI